MNESGVRNFAVGSLAAAIALTIAFVGSSTSRWAALLPCALWFIGGAAAALTWAKRSAGA